MKKIIFATTNQGKLKEVKEMLSDLDVQVISMKEAGYDIEIEEDGKTFLENATKKANTIMELSGELTLADDSGIEIDAMPDELGVYSARYLGENTTYEERFDAILKNLDGLPKEKRSARFSCCIVGSAPNGKTLSTFGRIEGFISEKPVGGNGFGYDPIFFVSELNKSMAELSSDEKNSISHRGEALQAMKELLKKEWL